MKLVRCLKGKVWDVAVDLRPQSPSYKRWYAQELSPQNARMMVIPEGFAHAFMALTDDARFLYKTTDVYAKDCERAIRWDDPAIGIDWPAGVTPLLAPKDAAAPLLADADTF